MKKSRKEILDLGLCNPLLSLLLGFERTTETAQRRATEVLDGMIADGSLTEDGNQISPSE